jgi:hypothetical protein
MEKDLSTSSSLFLDTALDLAHRLDTVGTAGAMAMALEARQLSHIFDRWRTARPATEERTSAITRLMDLTRRSLEHLSTSPAGMPRSGGAKGAL